MELGTGSHKLRAGSMFGVCHFGANCRNIKLYLFFTRPEANRRKWLIEHSKLYLFFTKKKFFMVKFLLASSENAKPPYVVSYRLKT